jgi:hypothetical protein
VVFCAYNGDGWRSAICLAVNHDRPSSRRRAGGIGALFNLVDFKYAWWNTIEAMDGYFLGALRLPGWPARGTSRCEYSANIGAIPPIVARIRLEYRANETQIKRE